MIEAKVILGSKAPHGGVIWSISAKYHRFIHGEVMTHRVFSRNAMSSRAVPVKKIIAQVWNDPAMPVHWGSNQSGMQAGAPLAGWRLAAVKFGWRAASKVACIFAWAFMKAGLSKQIANRVLEPWQWMYTIITATEWENFFALRDHEKAEPHFRDLAVAIREAMAAYVPQELSEGQWHLPYVGHEGFNLSGGLVRSAACCARVSYLNHEGKNSTIDEDEVLFDRLVGSMPIHASPIEHQAKAANSAGTTSKNLRGWIQYRELYEAQLRA